MNGKRAVVLIVVAGVTVVATSSFVSHPGHKGAKSHAAVLHASHFFLQLRTGVTGFPWWRVHPGVTRVHSGRC